MPGIRIQELHPIIVHFPIALLLVSVSLDFLAVILRKSAIAEASTWCLFLGVLGALAAGLTGSVASRDAGPNVDGNLLSLHSHLAFLSGALFALLLAIRLVWFLPVILEGLGNTFPALANAGNNLGNGFPNFYRQKLPALILSAYLIASLVGVGLISVTGYLGGVLVYDNSTGISHTAPAK